MLIYFKIELLFKYHCSTKSCDLVDFFFFTLRNCPTSFIFDHHPWLYSTSSISYSRLQGYYRCREQEWRRLLATNTSPNRDKQRLKTRRRISRFRYIFFFSSFFTYNYCLWPLCSGTTTNANRKLGWTGCVFLIGIILESHEQACEPFLVTGNRWHIPPFHSFVFTLPLSPLW